MPTASASVGAARFFINGLDTTTKGVDLVATYNFGAGDLGRWNLTAAYNYNKTKIDKRLNALGPLAQIPGLVLFGRIEGIRFTEGQPRDKIVLSADGEHRPVRADRADDTLRQGRVAGRRRAACSEPDEPDGIRSGRHLPRAASGSPISSFAGSRAAARNSRLARTICSTSIPTARRSGRGRPSLGGGQFPANQIYIPYSIFSPFGFNGRFLYGRAALSF